MLFRYYTEKDYAALCDFLVALSRVDTRHVNWNWARFEWMYEHPDFDAASSGSIGLWLSGDMIVGAAIYDMYFGEAFCAALPGHAELYPQILSYAYGALRDGDGLAVAICSESEDELALARRAGFVPIAQSECVMMRPLEDIPCPPLPEGLHLEELDHLADADRLGWLLWRGFDHGGDRAEFERDSVPPVRRRVHFDRRLSLAAVDGGGDGAAYCCLWYRPDTDYAYVEPVCTVPEHRGRGAAGALLCEAMRRARSLGAKRAYVISDIGFYAKLGFEPYRRYNFFRKSER